jgi:multiple sugar transport system permease protein
MHKIQKVALYVFLAAVSIWFVLPILWLLLTPFSRAPSLGLSLTAPTLKNFSELSHAATALAAFKNSAIISVSSVLIVVVLSSLASYALSRSNFPGKQLLITLLLIFSSVVTGVAAMVPVYALCQKLGLIDSYLAVVLVFSAGFLPTAIFILKDFIDRVPRAYEEAALVDGSRGIDLYFRIVFPLMGPGLAVVAVLCFVNIWSNFLVPFVLIRSNAKTPISVAIYQFFNEVGLPRIGLISAYSLLYALPVLLVYLWVSKKYGFGFFGGLKG